MRTENLNQVPRVEPYPLLNTDGLMDTKAAADYLGMSPLTLIDWRVKKMGPPWIACGRAIRYRKSALDAWADANTFTRQAS